MTSKVSPILCTRLLPCLQRKKPGVWSVCRSILPNTTSTNGWRTFSPHWNTSKGNNMAPLLPLWNHLSIILQRIVAHDWCALFCDYDGTLTPLVADPAAAHLSPVMQQVLTLLTHHPRYCVAVVSGRALADLQQRVPGRGLYLAGNHGLEIVGPGLRYHHPEARRLQPQVSALAQALRHDLAEFPGALVEDKGLTLTVHVRQVPAACVTAVEQRVVWRARPVLAAQQFVLRTGKAVLEVRPAVPWDKGTAVCR